MNRRDSLGALLALWAAPLAGKAEPAKKVPVIGFLSPAFPTASTAVSFNGLRDGLRSLGYVDGKTIKIESRWGEGKPERLPRLAEELVQLNVDVIVAAAAPSVMAATHATKTIPIVAADLETDPVAGGLVANLARPGGNITGLFLDQPALTGKWLQLLGEVVPGMQHVAVLRDATTGPYQLAAIKAAAHAMSIEIQIVEFRDAALLEDALNTALTNRPQALVQLSSPVVNSQSMVTAEFAAMHRLPGISAFRKFPESGGLMSYGPNLSTFFRRQALYVAKILHGAKPGDLPVELPNHFEFIVNLRAASAIGVKVSQSTLMLADEVIQ